MLPDSRIVIVTGTDTDVGKTISTAVVAAAYAARGLRVGVCKPAQTGLQPGEDGDIQVVGLLSELPEDDLHEFVRLPEPLAPTTAGRRADTTLPAVAEHAAALAELAADYDVLLVEGAGGVLVGLDGDGRGLLEMAAELAGLGFTPTFLVVTRVGLGTLNHTGLTCQKITGEGFAVAGLIVGSCPDDLDLASRCNLEELDQAAGAPIIAVLPAGLGRDPERVQTIARSLS